MSITAMLHVQKLFLGDMGFSFLLLSRSSTDALENLFSTLRSKNPVPRGLEFRSALKAATLSLFLRPSKDGSYADAGGFMLARMCSAERQHEVVDSVHTPDDMLDLEVLEQESLSCLTLLGMLFSVPKIVWPAKTVMVHSLTRLMHAGFSSSKVIPKQKDTGYSLSSSVAGC